MMKMTKKNVGIIVAAGALGYAEGRITKRFVDENKLDQDTATVVVLASSFVTGLILRAFRDK